MAIFSGRFSSRRLTVIHFKEDSEMTCLEDDSTNVNFSSDFNPSAGLPTVGVDCGSYDDVYRCASEKISRKPVVLPFKPPSRRPLCLLHSHLASPDLAPVSYDSRALRLYSLL
ncbi:hypothetical protein JG687_00017396 [Phytophthora cactorum]|uniref:Uncharacterized protein n=1 Tax=Phytophthora cactorum TaxID=29920 RepID=A0A8T1TRN0_9STRA|nr:hypothetical protein JG687_00017396 [Phytophthora cactorum]